MERRTPQSSQKTLPRYLAPKNVVQKAKPKASPTPAPKTEPQPPPPPPPPPPLPVVKIEPPPTKPPPKGLHSLNMYIQFAIFDFLDTKSVLTARLCSRSWEAKVCMYATECVERTRRQHEQVSLEVSVIGTDVQTHSSFVRVWRDHVEPGLDVALQIAEKHIIQFMNTKNKSDTLKLVRSTAHRVIGPLIDAGEQKYSLQYFLRMRSVIKDIEVFSFTPEQVNAMRRCTRASELEGKALCEQSFFAYALSRLFAGYLRCHDEMNAFTNLKDRTRALGSRVRLFESLVAIHAKRQK